MSERGGERAEGASIYQRRREVGGSMRRIAPYGRSLINSGRRQSRIRAAEHDCRNRRIHRSFFSSFFFPSSPTTALFLFPSPRACSVTGPRDPIE